jgi:hypothetical protein
VKPCLAGIDSNHVELVTTATQCGTTLALDPFNASCVLVDGLRRRR